MSTGFTVDKILTIVSSLPAGKVAEDVILLGLISAMNVKTLMSDIAKKLGTMLPPEMLMNSDINFSVFAMLGHVAFAMEDRHLSPIVLSAKKTYQSTIGYAQDITKFVSLANAVNKPKQEHHPCKVEGQDPRNGQEQGSFSPSG